MNKWDLRFIELAKHVSTWSKDKSTKVGAVIVNSDNNPISIGFNGFPAKVDENNERIEKREIKYAFTVHGEANSIANAAKNGQKTKDCVMYITFFPCCDCAGLIVNAGIKKIVCENPPDFNHERWGSSWRIAETILNEGNVEIVILSHND